MGIEALLLSQVITINGSTGQVVTRQADGTLALEDAAGGAESPLTLTASSATETPLTVDGTAGQSVPLQQWRDSAGVINATISVTGRVFGKSIRISNTATAGGFNPAYILSEGSGTGLGLVITPIDGATSNLVLDGSFVIRPRFITSSVSLQAADVIIGSHPAIAISKVFMPKLPTADPLTANQLWNDGGTLKISAG